MLIALLSAPYWNNRYIRMVNDAEAKDETVPPEARLTQAKIGACLSVVGLFCFAFTSYRNVHWIAPIVSSAEARRSCELFILRNWSGIEFFILFRRFRPRVSHLDLLSFGYLVRSSLSLVITMALLD